MTETRQRRHKARLRRNASLAQGRREEDICKNCGGSQHVVKQRGIYPGDADHYCANCGAYIRMRNSG